MRQETSMEPEVRARPGLLGGRELLLCVGPGGVGKTTCAAALALAAAQTGLHVVVVTVDPSLRLAQALGIDLEQHERGAQVHVATARGRVDALVLDGGKIFDTIVRTCASGPDAAQRMLGNAMYRALAQRLSGATEYAAMAQVQMLHDAGAHDLIILDTPPTANTIEFLRAPAKVEELIDNPAARLLRGTGVIGARVLGLGAGVVMRALEALGGSTFLRDLGEFLGEFTEILREFHRRGANFDSLLRSDKTTAVVVTTCAGFSVREAQAFMADLRGHGVHVGGVVLNRFDGPPCPEISSEALRCALVEQLGATEAEAHFGELLAVVEGERLRRRRAQEVRGRLLVDEPQLRVMTAKRRLDPPHTLDEIEALGREILAQAAAPALHGR